MKHILESGDAEAVFSHLDWALKPLSFDEIREPYIWEQLFEELTGYVNAAQTNSELNDKNLSCLSDVFRIARAARFIAFNRKKVCRDDTLALSDIANVIAEAHTRKLFDSETAALNALWHCYEVIGYADGYFEYHFNEFTPDRAEALRHATMLMVNSLNAERAYDAQQHEHTIDELTPHARRGKKTLSGSRKGHQTTHGSDDEKQARWSQYAAACIQKKSDHPLWSLTQVRKSVADDVGCSPRTITERTKQLKNHPAFAK